MLHCLQSYGPAKGRGRHESSSFHKDILGLRQLNSNQIEAVLDAAVHSEQSMSGV